MSTGHEVLALNKHEKKILDAIKSGRFKLVSIQSYTGFNRSTTVYYLRAFRKKGVVIYDDLLNSYKLKNGLKYKLCDDRKDEPVHMVNPIAPTFPSKMFKNNFHSNVTISHWTPEQVTENERKSNQHQPFLEFKRGELIPNENYNHAKHSR